MSVKPNHNMKLSMAGQLYIKHAEEEGGRPKLKAYNDGTGKWTIAWGCTHGVYKGMSCTPEQAQDMFDAEIANTEKGLRSWLKIDVSQGLWDALVSFGYNNGWGECPTLKAAVNSGNTARMRAAWMLYVHAYDEKKRKKLEWPGLVKRRKTELSLWEQVDTAKNPKTIDIPKASEVASASLKGSAPDAPGVVVTAAKSRSVWAQATALLTLVGGYFYEGANMAIDGLVWTVSQAPSVATDAQTVMASTTQMSDWLHVNSTNLSVGIAVMCISVALIRRILDKREQQL